MEKIIYLDKREPEEIAPDASEDERIEAAVRWINKKVQSTVHFGLIQIGYYLLNGFFGGSVEEALSRNPRKKVSFRKLCRRPDLLISSTHLISAVKLVIQEKQLAEEKSFQGLPVSHKIALLAVRDVGQRRELARRAASESWSVRALAAEARRTRVPDASAAAEAADAWARRLRRALGLVLDATAGEVPAGISPGESAALDRAILEVRRRLQSTLGGVRGIRSVAV